MTDRPTPETDAAKLSVADYAVTLEEARGVIRRLTRRVSELERELDAAREALQRLADCDWVITLPDRMDAVRKIALEALLGPNYEITK
jgi:hypothetical protein